MKPHLLGALAVLGLCASVAIAQTAAEQVVEQLTEQGYSGIEVRRAGQTIHVEASRDGVEHEYLYNIVTGETLVQEACRVGENESRDNGGSDDRDGNSNSGGFGRGEDGNHGHGNSGGYDEDNPGRSHDRGQGRSNRGRDGNGRHGSDKFGRGEGNGN